MGKPYIDYRWVHGERLRANKRKMLRLVRDFPARSLNRKQPVRITGTSRYFFAIKSRDVQHYTRRSVRVLDVDNTGSVGGKGTQACVPRRARASKRREGRNPRNDLKYWTRTVNAKRRQRMHHHRVPWVL